MLLSHDVRLLYFLLEGQRLSRRFLSAGVCLPPTVLREHPIPRCLYKQLSHGPCWCCAALMHNLNNRRWSLVLRWSQIASFASLRDNHQRSDGSDGHHETLSTWHEVPTDIRMACSSYGCTFGRPAPRSKQPGGIAIRRCRSRSGASLV